MPLKKFINLKLPKIEPDKCIVCPLLGLIAKEDKPKGSQQNFVCLGTKMSLSSRLANASRSEKKHTHILDRPCKCGLWQLWQTKTDNPGIMKISIEDYDNYILPLINQKQTTIRFK